MTQSIFQGGKYIGQNTLGLTLMNLLFTSRAFTVPFYRIFELEET